MCFFLFYLSWPLSTLFPFDVFSGQDFFLLINILSMSALFRVDVIYLQSTFLLFDVLPQLIFVTFYVFSLNIFYFSMFCPSRRLLSLIFCPSRRFLYLMFCPIRRFFISTVCQSTIFTLGVFYFDVLSVNRVTEFLEYIKLWV
jgi:hypothetical protein